MAGEPARDEAGRGQLAVLKALGDNTRYAIYLELARSPRPLATNDVARSLGLHPNTVRPHLERMREVGLVEVGVDASGVVGRPQHLYALAADAPSLGLEPPAHAWLARLLVEVAGRVGARRDDAREVGADAGRHAAEAPAADVDCIDALVADLDTLGFDPTTVGDVTGATIGFMHCPFRALAEAQPAVVCGLHEGMVEGFVAARGGTVREFRNLAHHRHPCQVDIEAGHCIGATRRP